MLIKTFIILLLGSSAALFSAGPVMHLWTAERFCEICGITDDKVIQEIIVGTEFPDIRYISEISRDLTHPRASGIQEIYESEIPFEAGMKLHAWLDVMREHFIDQDVYDAVALYAEGFSATLLKFIEEEILADIYDGRRWSHCFSSALPEELAFTDEGTVLKWHGMVQWSLAFRPSWLLWAQSYRGQALGIPVATLYNWCYLLPQLKEEPIFKRHLYDLLHYIETELKAQFIK